jgi:hypothetical protein
MPGADSLSAYPPKFATMTKNYNLQLTSALSDDIILDN